jgi:pimeloyl-ACP methyl ester carboxylesterase
MNRILYLHGFASGPSSSKARFFRDRLQAAGALVEIPDLAAGDFEHLTLTGQLSVIAQVARGEPVSLIGSSMGGYLAAIYASRHPEVARLVLLAPAFRFARRWQERYGPQALEQWRRRGSVEVFHYAEGCHRDLAYDLIEDAEKYDDYPDFRQPTLIFHGANDDVVPPVYSEKFAASHPNACLELLDAGHELLNVLDYMARAVIPFLLRDGGGA